MLTEQEIYRRLFNIISQSDDTNGAVAACLVRDGNIIAEAFSTNDGVHAEYALLKNVERNGERILKRDIIYTTVEPCSQRSPGGRGEKMGDCSSNLLAAGITHVVFAASDPDQSAKTRAGFNAAAASLKQVSDGAIVSKAIELFNSTCNDKANWLPT